MEWLHAFFELWGIGFWLVAGILSVIYIIGCENDAIGVSIFSTAVAGAILWWANPGWVSFVAHNPIILLIAFVAWVGIGVAWSVWRWIRYANDYVEECNRDGRETDKYHLALSRNKSRIINWGIYWPWSMVWNISGDFVKGVWHRMEGIYQGIADKALAKATYKPKQSRNN